MRRLTDEAVADADPFLVPREPLLDDLARLVQLAVQRVHRLGGGCLTLLRCLQLSLVALSAVLRGLSGR